MTMRRKLAVIGVFLLGASAVGTSVCRIIIYFQTVSASEKGKVIDTNRASRLWFLSILNGLLANNTLVLNS